MTRITHALELQDSTTEPPSAATDSTEPALANTASPFRFLQTGAPELDELLRQHRVSRGGTVHLDFADTQNPVPFLLATCKAALDRGRAKRVVFLAAPGVSHPDGDLEENADALAGRQLLPEFEEGLRAFGLDSFFNREEPGDPRADLRYLVASSPEEFESTMEDLLGGNAPAPDMVVVAGLEEMFPGVPQDTWDEMGWEEEVALVRAENERLCRWIETYGERCRETGTTLYLSRSAHPCNSSGATLFVRGLRPLLTAHCGATLFVARTQYQCVCCECPWVVPGVAAVPVYLYQGSALQGFAFALVQDGDDVDGFDGPFLDDAQVADIPRRMAAFVASLG